MIRTSKCQDLVLYLAHVFQRFPSIRSERCIIYLKMPILFSILASIPVRCWLALSASVLNLLSVLSVVCGGSLLIIYKSLRHIERASGPLALHCIDLFKTRSGFGGVMESYKLQVAIA